MYPLLFLIPILPLASFLLLVLFGYRLPKRTAALLGIIPVGLSALLALGIFINYLAAPPEGHAFVQTLWIWLRVENFAPSIAFRLDALSLIFTLIVTFVGFLILIYSSGYMAEDEGFNRFFAYMNLFVFSMLTLVLADNLLLLYLGWEGVGLCSYLLIGFWYRDPANGRAAMKAFIVTRVGDTALAIALFLLAFHLGTLEMQEIMRQAPLAWAPGAALATAVAALLLGGAVGKSAQLPLQTWLPDAMAGPTPVSALIHAATMVTAGVYLIARLHVLFTLAPVVLLIVGIVGAVTLLVGAFSALAQHDLKRVLAYSTMSQIGYMFLALGVGAWTAAVFHFFTHAFFKALLFLAAGAVIVALHEEHDMRKMGGLRTRLPVAYWTFLIGVLSLASFPLITAGFYSKGYILEHVWMSPEGHLAFWTAGMLGALLTAIYSFRMVYLVFHGPVREGPVRATPPSMAAPLVILSVFALIAGFVQFPWEAFGSFLHAVFPEEGPQISRSVLITLETSAGVLTLLGIWIAHLLFGHIVQSEEVRRTPAYYWLAAVWRSGWGFDGLYDRLFVRPYTWLAQANKGDVIDLFYTGAAWGSLALGRAVSLLQTGKVRWYAAGIALGVVVVIAIVVFV
ncbi:MAG: NADH-quinone oxidoreductase subunit L [Armatimonadota bacterium]